MKKIDLLYLKIFYNKKYKLIASLLAIAIIKNCGYLICKIVFD